MPNAAAAFAQYRKTETETLTQRDLLVRLYFGIERFINIAAQSMREKQWYEANENCQKAKRIFIELLSTLNLEVGGQLAQQLRDLYLFMITEIVESNVHHDPERILKLLPVVATLRSAWEEIPAEEANVSSLNGDAQSNFSART
ncbi:MAG: flagellar export chaperone FliS [Planctomycetota bacterium]|nr:MAG: flagellar export chaperone FliS [Planctomycetota bacterium]